MQATEPLAELSGVYKRFGKQEVLSLIDLKLFSGQITGLLGPSGAGKTTIVNIIVGSYLPTAGTVRVLGETPPFKNARKQLGFMPQSEALYLDLTANQNLRFFGSLYGMSKSSLNQKIPEVLHLVRLGDEGRKLVADFSGGMKRRLSLAIALLHDPALLVLDEPTIGLDPKHRLELWRGFRERAASAAGLLITTHVMDEAAFCDRLLMVQDGRIIADDSPEKLIQATNTQTLEEAFLAFENQSPNLNQIVDQGPPGDKTAAGFSVVENQEYNADKTDPGFSAEESQNQLEESSSLESSREGGQDA